MAQDVYVDLLFLINFSMDYLCLYICAKIMKRKLTLGKLLISSSIGALYSVLSLFIPLSDLLFVAADILIGLLICAIAFHEKSRGVGSTLLCTFLFVGISMMTGGCMTAIFNLLNRLDLPLEGIEGDNISTYLFAIVAAIAGFVSLRSGQVISRRSSIGECMLEVTLGDKKITVNALSDSGNLVKDPISGKPVILIDKAKFSELTDISVYDSFLVGKKTSSSEIRGLRLIPINTASGKGLLAASIPDKLNVYLVDRKGKSRSFELDALISPTDINNSASGCSAIIPAEILKL